MYACVQIKMILHLQYCSTGIAHGGNSSSPVPAKVLGKTIHARQEKGAAALCKDRQPKTFFNKCTDRTSKTYRPMVTS